MTTDALDVMLLQDFTGSQIPYQKMIASKIDEIVNTIQSEGRIPADHVRYGLVAFRDHPPQEETFVTKPFPFSTKAGDLADNLATLDPTGGGDAPECQGDAMVDALNAQWRDDAVKVAILITDSPPHGIGEDGDGFPGGCPAKIDPVQIANKMASAGITLYVVACEPTLSTYYKHARDFYVGLTKITGGRVFDVGDPKYVPIVISGTAVEALDIERLVAQHIDEVRSLNKNGDLTQIDIAKKLYRKLDVKDVALRNLEVEDMHDETQTKKINSNVDVWFKAKTIVDARDKIQEIPGNRITEKYLAGAVQPEPKIQNVAIQLEHAEIIVQKCLARK